MRTRQNFVNGGRRSFWSASESKNVSGISQNVKKSSLTAFVHSDQECLQAKVVGEFWLEDPKKFPGNYSILSFPGGLVCANWMGSVVVGKCLL